jgi:hypothetical protein
LSALLATRGSRVAPLPPPVQSHNQLRGGRWLCLVWAVTALLKARQKTKRGGLSKPPRLTAFAAVHQTVKCVCSESPWWRGPSRARRERKVEEHRDPVPYPVLTSTTLGTWTRGQKVHTLPLSRSTWVCCEGYFRHVTACGSSPSLEVWATSNGALLRTLRGVAGPPVELSHLLSFWW